MNDITIFIVHLFLTSIFFGNSGRSPARIIQIAPVAIVKRFTTFVIAISPTFCENGAIGRHPTKDEIADAYPSHLIEPYCSIFSLIFLVKIRLLPRNQFLIFEFYKL